MIRRAIIMISAVVGAVAVSVGATGTFSPFKAAEASPKAGEPAALDALLSEMQPGAIVTKQADGGFSVRGTATPAVRAEVERAKELAQRLPTSIRCDGSAATVTCTPVSGDGVIAALRAGDTGLYGRTIYRGITDDVTARGAPMFEAGELICGDVGGNGTMSCSRVDHVRPVIAADETIFVTYQPYNATFNADGNPTFHVDGEDVVPLARASK